MLFLVASRIRNIRLRHRRVRSSIPDERSLKRAELITAWSFDYRAHEILRQDVNPEAYSRCCAAGFSPACDSLYSALSES
jgi:hypothetical protein